MYAEFVCNPLQGIWIDPFTLLNFAPGGFTAIVLRGKIHDTQAALLIYDKSNEGIVAPSRNSNHLLR